VRDYRFVIRRFFKFEYRLPAPVEVRYRLFGMNAHDQATRLKSILILDSLGDPTAAETLIEALAEPLPTRLFAAEALRHLVPDGPPFDPYAPDEDRDAARDGLTRWWGEHRDAALDDWLRVRLDVSPHDWAKPDAQAAALIAGLTHDDLVVRFHSHRRLVGESDHDIPYDYHWPPPLRAEAAEAWRAWLTGGDAETFSEND